MNKNQMFKKIVDKINESDYELKEITVTLKSGESFCGLPLNLNVTRTQNGRVQ